MQLIIKNLVKNYGSKQVLKGIDFTFEEGKIYGLLGRNGSGKTTFFNCVNGDTDINAGEFILKENADSAGSKLIPADIGYVVSTPTVPEFMTGREFLQFFIDIHDEIKDTKLVKYIFESCGSKESPDAIKKSVEALQAAGYNAEGHVSEGTAHEFLTWRRALYTMAQKLFK